MALVNGQNRAVGSGLQPSFPAGSKRYYRPQTQLGLFRRDQRRRRIEASLPSPDPIGFVSRRPASSPGRSVTTVPRPSWVCFAETSVVAGSKRHYRPQTQLGLFRGDQRRRRVEASLPSPDPIGFVSRRPASSPGRSVTTVPRPNWVCFAELWPRPPPAPAIVPIWNWVCSAKRDPCLPSARTTFPDLIGSVSQNPKPPNCELGSFRRSWTSSPRPPL
jgi:hypothetical protein